MSDASERCSNGMCITVKESHDGRLIIRSDTDTGFVAADRSEWVSFLAAVKRGEFDDV
jgi:hypothetical protein